MPSGLCQVGGHGFDRVLPRMGHMFASRQRQSIHLLIDTHVDYGCVQMQGITSRAPLHIFLTRRPT